MGQVTVKRSGVPALGFCMIPMQTLSSGNPCCGLLCGDLVSGGLLSRVIDFGSDKGRISGGLLSGGLVSRNELNKRDEQSR